MINTLSPHYIQMDTQKTIEPENYIKSVVASVDNKKSKKGSDYYEITLEGEKYFGLKYSGFGLCPFKVGDTIEFTFKTNGNFLNVDNILNLPIKPINQEGNKILLAACLTGGFKYGKDIEEGFKLGIDMYKRALGEKLI